MSDREAVERYLAGDREALAPLYQAYNPKVHAAAMAVLHDPGEAEECCSGAWVIVLRRLASFDASRSFGAWVCGIARRLAHNTLHCRACHPRLGLDDLGPDEVPATPVLGVGLSQRARERLLWQRMAVLGPTQRRDVWRRFGLGLSNQEIAELDGRSAVSVASSVHRGLATLRRMYHRTRMRDESGE